MSTKYEQKASGLVVPVQPPSKPPRQFGAVEFMGESDRAKAHKALQSLSYLTDYSAIKIDEPRKAAHRKLIWGLAELLLGDDVCFEERT